MNSISNADITDIILANVKACQNTTRTTPNDRVCLANDNVVRYNRERELLDLWRARRSDLEGLTQRTAVSLLRSMKFRVMDRIIETAGKNARLSGYDDDLFECAKQLTDIYRSAVEYYKHYGAELNTFSIKNLISGIYSVLNERLRAFEARLNGSKENPAAIERIKLLSAGVAYFMLSFNDSEKTYKYAREHAFELARQFTPEYFNAFIEGIQGDILESFIEINYPAYKKAVQACISGLNNLRGRKTLLYYYKFLTEESGTLSFIAKQASDIGQELSRNAGNSLEFDIVRTFLSIVNEAQMFYNSDCGKIIPFFQETGGGVAVEPESMESLYAACGEMLANSRLIAARDYSETSSRYKDDVELLRARFEDSADLFLGEISARLNVAELRAEYEHKANDLVFEAKQAAEAIACVFARQASFYNENINKLSALDEYDIMKGINETLIIKTEILTDSIASLDANKYSLNENDLTFTGKEREQLLKELFSILRAKIFTETDDGKIIMDAFYDEAAQSEIITAYKKRVADICQKEEERIEKAVKRFLKDSVLFEIITFEEILQYSVTRLRESDNDAVKDYVDMIDENARIIENTLKKTGIAMIRPNPHEIFNGREHEILMAEHIEGFGKGEIIKYMTSGYRLNGQILIRANVIAAK